MEDRDAEAAIGSSNTAAFRSANKQINEARTPEELNRIAEQFLRENLDRSNALRLHQGDPAAYPKPETMPLNARERSLLFFGRAPEHHTAERKADDVHTRLKRKDRWPEQAQGATLRHTPARIVFTLAWLTVALIAASASQSNKLDPDLNRLAAQAEQARAAGRLDEAVRLYQQSLRRRPQWKEGWWALSTSYYEAGKFAEARRAFQKLSALEPRSGAAWAMLGLSEYELRDYPSALAHLQRGRERGLDAQPQLQASAGYHEAILLNRSGQFEAAYNRLELLARGGDANDDLLLALGSHALRRAQSPQETPAADRELSLLAGRAAFYEANNHSREAREAHDELKARYPDTPGVAYARGLFLLREAPDEALAEFRRELELSPQHVEARLQIALELLKRNDAAAGLPLAEEAVKLAPGLAVAHYALGRLLLAEKQADRAPSELLMAVKLAPHSPEIRFALAQAYERAGRKAEAARARTEFLRLDKLRR
ncbi:MAG: tetratricopeptide repeat protein [Blastocatellia bacterium]